MTKHRGIIKITFYLVNCAILLVALLFMPAIPAFERTGDNFFKVRLNGVWVGSVGEATTARKVLAQARRELADGSESMVFAPAELVLDGEEVWLGRIDDENKLREAMVATLENSVVDPLCHAYTVKINEFSVNLADGDEVVSLLQTILGQYDRQGAFCVSLEEDSERELPTLTARVSERKKEESRGSFALGSAGAGDWFAEVFLEIEADLNKSEFSGLEYGLVALDFAQRVEIAEAYLPDEAVSSLDEALAQMTMQREKEQVYEVRSGDTLSQIAEDNGLTMEELLAINPVLENEGAALRVGDELRMKAAEPVLSVLHTQRIYMEENFEAETVYIDNDSWYTTRSEVRRQPSAGYRKAAVLVTSMDDNVLAREIIKEEVEIPATPKLVERGTKTPPTYVRPVSGGRQSSGFGGRSAPVKGASTNHKGIDWAVPVGTAVRASCGGTVTRAGWVSGYGYAVYIQHEDGRETRYGHLSKVMVNVGQKVSQGDKIALSGNTGRSSGPHLHFEMRINGQAVNPMQYLQ